MRKTLLIAAAALAAGVISSQAQSTPVYSQNVVGYVNSVIPAGKFQIIGSQLINGSDVGGTNMDPSALFGPGLISSSHAPGAGCTNTTLLLWGGAGFATYTYYNAADATTWIGDPSDPAGFYDNGQNLMTGQLTNGTAIFLHNNAGINLTNTTVGTVFQGTNTIYTIKPGLNLISLSVPVVTNGVVEDDTFNGISWGLPPNLLTSRGAGLPPNGAVQDTMLYWGGSGYATYYYYNAADATAWIGDAYDPAGFYDAGQNYQPLVPNANQGFFLKHIGSAITWTNTFSVQ